MLPPSVQAVLFCFHAREVARASLGSQTVKCLPAIWETQVQSLGSWRSPEEGNGNPLQYFCLENPMDRGSWQLQSMGSQRVGHDRVTNRRRQWHPTPVLLSGKSHGWRSLEGCSPWGCWGLDTTEWIHFHFSLSCIGEGNGNPLQCSCLENSRDGGGGRWGGWWGGGCLVGFRLWGHTESDTNEAT